MFECKICKKRSNRKGIRRHIIEEHKRKIRMENGGSMKAEQPNPRIARESIIKDYYKEV